VEAALRPVDAGLVERESSRCVLGCSPALALAFSFVIGHPCALIHLPPSAREMSFVELDIELPREVRDLFEV
jgi:hypothetical protein